MGGAKRLGKSYSVLNTEKEKLALPVLSKKRLLISQSFKTNVMEIPLEPEPYMDVLTVLI